MGLNRKSEDAVWPPQPVREDRLHKYQDFLADELHFRSGNGWRVSRWELIRALRHEFALTFADAKAVVWAYCDIHHVLPLYNTYFLVWRWVTFFVGLGSFGAIFGKIMKSSHHRTAHAAAAVNQMVAIGIAILAATLGVMIVLTVTGDLLDLRYRKGGQDASDGRTRTRIERE